MVSKPKNHVPVLLSETLEYLKIRPNSIILDCTLGLGGHTKAILDSNPTVKVIGLDQDESNLEEAKSRLKGYGSRVRFYKSNFEDLYRIVEKEGSVGGVNGILFDLGICSTHIDEPARGFSFREDGPLDMRFDTAKDFTAADAVKEYSVQRLQEIFSKYGEETESKTVAEAIVEARRNAEIKTTLQLNKIIENAKRFSRPGHAAGTNVFQALRIEVNQEFRVLEKGLDDAIKVLARGGRLVVIAYHSLEDRIVKLKFKEYEAKGKKDEEFKLIKFIVKTPLKPTMEEIEKNPRCRSALMRVVEKV